MASVEENHDTKKVGDQIDTTIQEMENLYRSMTGKDAPAPDPAYAPIPAEKDPSQHVDEQMNRLLNLLGRTGATGEGLLWVPPMTVWESDSEIIFWLDIPGVGRDQIKVQIQGNRLTVSGERQAATTPDLTLRFSEQPFGSFRKILLLPPAVDFDTPVARFREGVLEIRLRKQPSRLVMPRPVAVA